MAATVWIVVQHREGRIHAMSREALAAGQELAGALGGTAEAVLLGDDIATAAEELAGVALGAVRTASDPALADYTPAAYVAALESAVREAGPALVVFPHTYQSVDYMPRLAQALGAPVVPEVVAHRRTEEGIVWRRPVLGGKLQAEVRVKGEGPVLVSVQSGCFPVDGLVGGSAPIEALSIDLSELVADREILGVEEVAGEHVDLSKAETIVAVGRGIGGSDNIDLARDLAEALGGEIGASRPVIDSGWLERDRQIGSSGQTVAPKLYVAAGISGAIQHLVGMKGAQVVVAINKDASAPIFGVARYGIVGDLTEILPALTAAVREAKA